MAGDGTDGDGVNTSNYVDLKAGDEDGVHVKWGPLMARLGRGAIYTWFLVVATYLSRMVGAVQDAVDEVKATVYSFTELSKPFATATEAASTSLGNLPGGVQFIAALFVAVSVMAALDAAFGVIQQ